MHEGFLASLSERRVELEGKAPKDFSEENIGVSLLLRYPLGVGPDTVFSPYFHYEWLFFQST